MWIYIDCYDSFSYSLIDLLKRYHDDITVIHYDDENLIPVLKENNPSRIILSPGPGHPLDYKILFQVIELYKHTPILGICLGHQIIGESFGFRCQESGEPLHGKTSRLLIEEKNHPLYENIQLEQMSVMHYHSLIIENSENTSEHLKVLATDPKGQIMIIEHKLRPIMGFQFHPESILTTDGQQLIQNWVKYYNLKS